MVTDINELYNSCIEEPDVIFKMISMERFDVIEKLIDDNQINVNLVDSVGNDVVTRLLKAKQYNLVFELMKKRNWNVNHKNVDGDTFGHILAHDNSCWAIKVIEQLTKKKNYIPNTKNNTPIIATIRAGFLLVIFSNLIVFSNSFRFNICVF